jgi:hypothetical protein
VHKIVLSSPFSRRRACELVMKAPDGFVASIGQRTRTDDQNRKLWPMLEDIRTQVEGMDAFSRDDIKLRFLNSLGVEMRWLPELDGPGSFPVGLRSSTLTRSQFSLLIDLLYKYGAEKGVVWTERKDDAA